MLAALAGCTLLLAAAPGAQAADDTYVEPFDPTAFTAGHPTDGASVRADEILVNATRFAVTTWWNTTKNYDAQTGTYLDFGGTTEHFIRPAASEAYALAASLATGHYDATATGVTATNARAIATKLVRSLAYRHRATTAAGWGDAWQSAYWAALAGQAGWMLWGDLTASDRELVRKMVEHEANRFIGWPVPYWRNRAGAFLRACGDTAAEESAWNARLLYLAPTMMPQHSRRSGWTYKAHELSIGAFASPSDVTSRVDVRGRPLGDWLEGSNVTDDGGVVNHVQYQPDYMSTITEQVNGGLARALGGHAVPANTLLGSERNYDALVDYSWWPGPALPCPGARAFVRPTAANPTGTIYVDGSPDIHYPHGPESGSLRQAAFMTLDTMMDAFGRDGLVAQKADYWEDLHADIVLSSQLRPLAGGPSDGRHYRATAEFSYPGAEEWVAARAAEAWLTKWLDHQRALTETNAADQIVIDDSDRGVSIAGTWTRGSPAGNGPQVFGPSVRYKARGTGAGYVRFTPRMTQTRTYRVYVWWNAAPSQATNTPFTINHAGGSAVVTRNQQLTGGQWVLLGRWSMGPGSYVQVSDDANGYVVADGVLLDPS